MAYIPGQANEVNNLLKGGLSTADAAKQANIANIADFAVGNNGEVGGLIPGAGSAPATGQSVFQSVAYPQLASGEPAQSTQLAMTAKQVEAFRAIPGNENIPFVQNPEGPLGDFIRIIDIGQPTTDTARPAISGSGQANSPLISTGPPTTTARPATSASGQANAAPVIAPAIGTGNVELLLIQAPPLSDNRVVSVDVVPVPAFNTPGAAQNGQGGTVPTAEPAPVFRIPGAAQLGQGGTVPTAAPAPVTGTGINQSAADLPNDRRMNDADFINSLETASSKFNTVQQATLQSTYKQPGNGDWRFRISLAEGADYLYKAAGSADDDLGFYGPGILAPLATTNGVVFPYTPQVSTSYQAKYNTYDLIHSNYRGVFYQNSSVSEISVRGTFTAQDTSEAAYLLAVIHFFRSVTKMFYGQDSQRGAPPPLVYLTGLGDYQFNQHPAVVTSFEYALPNDVDYIRANNPNNFGTDLGSRRAGALSPPSNPLAARVIRMVTSKLFPGAEPPARSQPAITNSVTNTAKATYVPTKIDINISLLPVQTRDQVSKQFSLAKFADGSLLRGGFW